MLPLGSTRECGFWRSTDPEKKQSIVEDLPSDGDKSPKIIADAAKWIFVFLVG
jgi:hypothetical protein